MAERPYLLTKIVKYDPVQDIAYVNVRYSTNNWILVQLKKSSLVALDLCEHDSFKWRLREDGIVVQEDILEHPRRADPGEDERTINAFTELEKMMN